MKDKIREIADAIEKYQVEVKEYAPIVCGENVMPLATTLYNLMREKEPDGKCFECGEMTESLSCNPSLWSFFFPHIDGQKKHRYYHTKCLYPILKDYIPKDSLRLDEEKVEKLLSELRYGTKNRKYGDGFDFVVVSEQLDDKASKLFAKVICDNQDTLYKEK